MDVTKPYQSGRPDLGQGWLRVLLCLFALVSFRAQAEPPPEMVLIPQGVHRPLFVQPGETNQIQVGAFLLDRLPVTNGDFLKFVEANPKWRRSRVKRLFADENYLKHWSDDVSLGSEAEASQPVTWVSWFAAKAYADWQGKRLPTVTEWEYAASVGNTNVIGSQDVEFQTALRRWYSSPTPVKLPPVAAGKANYWGVHDLHGLVWEWTADFNSTLVTGDARGDTGIERQLFCGAGSANTQTPSDFPAYLRYGFRSSLKAAYAIHNLGFRCAKNL